jgi:hypothetical protein
VSLERISLYLTPSPHSLAEQPVQSETLGEIKTILEITLNYINLGINFLGLETTLPLFR